jgi:hypothetical protein
VRLKGYYPVPTGTSTVTRAHKKEDVFFQIHRSIALYKAEKSIAIPTKGNALIQAYYLDLETLGIL